MWIVYSLVSPSVTCPVTIELTEVPDVKQLFCQQLQNNSSANFLERTRNCLSWSAWQVCDSETSVVVAYGVLGIWLVVL